MSQIADVKLDSFKLEAERTGKDGCVIQFDVDTIGMPTPYILRGIVLDVVDIPWEGIKVAVLGPPSLTSPINREYYTKTYRSLSILSACHEQAYEKESDFTRCKLMVLEMPSALIEKAVHRHGQSQGTEIPLGEVGEGDVLLEGALVECVVELYYVDLHLVTGKNKIPQLYSRVHGIQASTVTRLIQTQGGDPETLISRAQI
ncbi:hypothetical protein C8R46DRAFT_1133318 [Mycena filopes]|nr:hypothetical protein C8R46DRAFT_1133318 [Mycena filopes]